MESASHPAPAAPGLKKNAINYVSSVVIGVASTAPGYSLAATLGFVVSAVGLQSPAVLWLAFVPMLCVATAYLYMNKADPDCGTTFSWVGKAMGPWVGWMAGWAIIVADVIVMANLAQIAGLYSVLLFDSGADPSTVVVTAIGVVWIAVMTLICYLGTELSARMQRYLLTAEVLTLAAFAVIALVKVYGGDALDTSVKPDISWFSPFAIDDTSALTAGVLLSVFIYWGWDSAVSVNEETEDASQAPGRSAVASTVILVLIYLIVATAALAFGGAAQLKDQGEVLQLLSTQVFGSPWDKVLIIAVLTSAAASTQTTILPTARTSLSMARVKAMPKAFASIHEKHLTPSTSTVVMGVLSIVWYVGLTLLSENILFDSIAALGLMIAFYYGLTGFACAIYYRRMILKDGPTARAAGGALILGSVILTFATLLESNVIALVAAAFLLMALVFGYMSAKDFKAFTLVGALPSIGGVILTYVFFKSCLDYSHPENSESGDSWLGLGPPLIIGVGFLLLGAFLMLWWSRGNPEFFRAKAETFREDVPPTGPAAAPAPAAGGS